MKKEAAILSLVVILITGCTQTQDLFSKWSSSPPIYYYSDAELSFLSKYNLDPSLIILEICGQIISGDPSIEKGKDGEQCFTIFKKNEAFMQKNYEVCKEIYSEEKIETYEECLAPIVSYSAILLKDPNYCSEYISNQRVLSLCERDYNEYA